MNEFTSKEIRRDKICSILLIGFGSYVVVILPVIAFLYEIIPEPFKSIIVVSLIPSLIIGCTLAHTSPKWDIRDPKYKRGNLN